jgi:hypothetical protein
MWIEMDCLQLTDSASFATQAETELVAEATEQAGDGSSAAPHTPGNQTPSRVHDEATAGSS